VDVLLANLDRYAAVLVRVGLNVQPDQKVLVLGAPVSAPELVRRVVAQAYAAGARDVFVEWFDDECARLRMAHAPLAALDEVPRWKVEGYTALCEEEGAAILSLEGADPEYLHGVAPERVNRALQAGQRAFERLNTLLSADRVSWAVGAVATPGWARRLYPGRPSESAVAELWADIFGVCRVEAADPVAAWRAHLDRLAARARTLNDLRLRRLVYRAPGTDLVVELPEGHRWVSGGAVNAKGVPFVANLPTEEVFTLPHREGVTGTVRATLPLYYAGNRVEGIRLTFREGEVVDFDAERGREVLAGILDTDDGARRLGEVALVDQSSPVARLGRLFQNTLFDENASSHLALGRAYPFTLEGGAELSPDELRARGANHSLTHVDFMVGSEAFDVDGEDARGRRIPVLRAGRFVLAGEG
jgi:aminopeptidase